MPQAGPVPIGADVVTNLTPYLDTILKRQESAHVGKVRWKSQDRRLHAKGCGLRCSQEVEAGECKEMNTDEEPVNLTSTIDILRRSDLPFSHQSSQPIGIGDVPIELLRIVFDYLGGEDRPKDYQSVRALKNARLTCRLFDELAAPLLFRTLQLALDHESLKTVENISQRPRLASGVRNIQLQLAYRSQEMSDSIILFTKARLLDLDDLAGFCHFTLQRYRMSCIGPSDHASLDAIQRCEEAINSNYYIARAWQSIISPTREPPDFVQDPRYIAAHEMILEGHERYRIKHEEQRRLIEEGTFIRILTEVVKHMPLARHVHFTDRPGRHLPSDPQSTITDSAKLMDILTKAESWGLTETLPGHVVGKLIPLACSRVREFQFGGGVGNLSHKCLRLQHPDENDREHVDNFLSAVMSSPCLQTIDVTMHAFGLNDGSNESANELYPADSLISAVRSKSVKRVWLSDVALLCPSTLEKFCGLLDSNLRTLALYSVRLIEGSWGGMRNVIRDRFAPQYQNWECDLTFKRLIGGEYGMSGLGRLYDPHAPGADHFLSKDWATLPKQDSTTTL